MDSGWDLNNTKYLDCTTIKESVVLSDKQYL
jgi:hypothetical protein